MADLKASAATISANPCFRRSFLWAAAVGVMMGAHRLKQGGSAAAATGALTLGTLGTFGTQWYLCRQQEYDRKLAMRAYHAQAAAVQAGMGVGTTHTAADYAYDADAAATAAAAGGSVARSAPTASTGT